VNKCHPGSPSHCTDTVQLNLSVGCLKSPT